MWAGLDGIDNLGGLVWTGLVCRGSPSPLSVPLVISGGDGDAIAAASVVRSWGLDMVSNPVQNPAETGFFPVTGTRRDWKPSENPTDFVRIFENSKKL